MSEISYKAMAINISESTLTKILEYLTDQTSKGDRQAQQLLHLLPNPSSGNLSSNISDFPKRLFAAWQELADLQVGENCWSYPVPFADLAENLGISIQTLIQYLETTPIDNLQLLAGRGENYLIKSQQVGDLAFHSAPKLSKPEKKAAEIIFKVGDRIRVNANRPQYTNQTGIVDQVISVSCRIKLDNGWVAFLPNHCLEKI
ncbi:hypothetical protein [Synechococcus sp. PCC 7502]|uniref:hypothetical protein n=1 Tax=Synechococcus sp. PCC 7502 TaxID=1173263 RepID=UPI0002EAA081|nr:hypothetical protein [Synechococcus sp. PCC 7502]